MAKRNYSRKGNKIQPAALTLEFPGIQIPAGGGEDAYLDLSQVTSLVNRRFYRQGINWAVAGVKILSLDSTGSPSGIVSLRKLPNTWVMSNAWEKSFRTWQKMNNEALAESESIRPKFLDFKIYADAQHHQLGFGANLLPDGFNAGEWVSSKAVVPFGPASPGNTVEFEFIATGANFPGISGATGHNAVSLIEGYAASRGLPYSPDPNTPADADDADGSTPENWMAAIFNEGTDQDSEVIENLRTDNNEAPYPFSGDAVGNADTQYPNGANQGPGLQIHDYEFITGTTIGGTTRLKGGNFPAGLMKFTFANTNETGLCSYFIYIDLVPGNHRGYLCEPMTEM